MKVVVENVKKCSQFSKSITYYYEQGQYYQLTIFINVNRQKHQICLPYSAIGRQNTCRGRTSYPLVTTFYRDNTYKCAFL